MRLFRHMKNTKIVIKDKLVMECVCKLKYVVLNNGTNNIAWIILSLLLACDLIFNPVQKSISLVIL